jgi:hypothetical protein
VLWSFGLNPTRLHLRMLMDEKYWSRLLSFFSFTLLISILSLLHTHLAEIK